MVVATIHTESRGGGKAFLLPDSRMWGFSRKRNSDRLVKELFVGQSLENLPRYITIASFSQEQMTTLAVDGLADGVVKVSYVSEDGKATRTVDALDWLAQLTTCIPNRAEPTVH